jgi:ATP phosphoribosyltransferase
MTLLLALPKGRILKEFLGLLEKAGITPEAAFTDPASRQIRFKTSDASLDLLVVRSSDVATFVAFGAAHLGVAGLDSLEEAGHDSLYRPLNLNIGHCRLSVAGTAAQAEKYKNSAQGHIRVASKYPNLTRRHFAGKGVQAEIIKLHGAMEIAPHLGLGDVIVDLVSSGATLHANGLQEIETILPVSSWLIAHKTTAKVQAAAVQRVVGLLKEHLS